MAENLNLQTVETVDTQPFRKLVMTIGELPTSFVESMTYYELLAWFTNYLETVIIPTVNNNAECVEELQQKFIKLKGDTEKEISDFTTYITNLYNELKDFVDNYFDNLDVQDEIDHKLDEMASEGTLQEIIASYLQSNVAWCFDTVADMKLSENLVAGSYAQTLGFHTLNDGGGAIYYITDSGTANEMNVIAVGDLYANLVVNPSSLNVKQFGAYGDGEHDDLSAIQATINYGRANNYYDVLIPSGNYHVSNAIEIPELMHVHGNTYDTTFIEKTTNNVDSVNNVDAIIILRKTNNYASSYTERQHFRDIALLGNNTTSYGIYCATACPRCYIHTVRIQKVQTGIQISSGWLFTIENVSVNPKVNGIDINGTSTTLNLKNVYVNGGTGTGYKLRGIGYSALENIACDGNTGTPYDFQYCNLSIDGLGCECQGSTIALSFDHSNIDINNSTIVVNPTSSSYKCIFVGANSFVTINKCMFHDYGENNLETPGKFIQCGNGGNIKFIDCEMDKKFATANTFANNDDGQKISDKNGDFIFNGAASYCGIGHVNVKEEGFVEKSNLITHMGGIIFNNRGGARYSLDGVDRRYKPAHNLGDIFINQAPALNGIAMFQQTSDSIAREMAGSITAVDISGTTGSITMDTLDLTDFSKNRGIKVETGHDIESSTGGTASITGVDFVTNTLSLSNINGSFDVSDSIIYKGKTNVGSSTYSNIQAIGYGTSAQRPSSPVNGYLYWDTTLGKAIWRVGSKWRDATGTEVV